MNLNLIKSNKFGAFSQTLLAAIIYIVISVSLLFGLVVSSGDVAQGDWGIPLTSNAAINDFNSRLFVRSYNGFGVTFFDRWCFPFLPLVNAVLGPIGFVGGAEIKILSVFLVSLSGISAYILARSFRLNKSSSFLAGLFFMTAPIVFNWLIFGWIYYLIAYALFPLMILVTKKFIETRDLRYALINGLILSIATIQPTFVLIYPLFIFLFALFESRRNFESIKRGLLLILISLTVWLLLSLSFFTSYNNPETLSFYHTSYLHGIRSQFINFDALINPIRLWGSTFNYQFETYFPQQLVVFSFIPIFLAMLALILRPFNKRILFFSFSYLFVFLAYFIFHNMNYIVSNLPYGAIFEAPSIFLVPASLGLAMLIGYANKVFPEIAKHWKILSTVKIRKVSFVFILVLIILASVPWWTGQISGEPIRGAPTKLNLYQIPSGYTTWTNNLNVSQQYFVLYLPLSPNVQLNNSYFSEEYEGINSAIFTLVNNLPYVSVSNSSMFLHELMSETSQVGERWGSSSIRYIVVYIDALSTYDMSDILVRLSAQDGLVEVERLPGVVVFENMYAKPVVYSENDSADVEIVSINPTLFRVKVNSTTPFTLVLNQVYSSGWRVWVNGSVLPDSTHFKDDVGFNEWKIDTSGNMAIDIYYEPQTLFLISKIIASGTLVVITLYIVLASYKKFRHKPKK